MIRLTFALIASGLAVVPSLAAGPDRTFPVDPVELVAGREVPGVEAQAFSLGRYTYLFATPANRETFAADPARYEIQLGGACARMGPLSGEGDPAIFAVHDGRVYIFASQQCRGTFLKRAADLLEADDPPPAWTPQSVERGRALLELAVEAMGGAAAIDGVRSYVQRVEQEVVSGDKTWQVRHALFIAAPGRVARETRWDEQAWGEVVNGRDAFLYSSTGTREMADSQRRSFEKEIARHPLAALRDRRAPGTLVSHTGSGEIDGRQVELVAIAGNGRTGTLSIDAQNGRILAVSYRGRGPNAIIGVREDRYSDFRRVGPLTLPFHRAVIIDGAPVERMAESLAAVELDVQIDPAVFARRGP